jgi:uncharacterized repeat protein (TIGR03803 family)
MTTKVQNVGWNSGICQGRIRIALALTVVLVAAVVSSQPAQAQSFNVVYAFTGGADGGTPPSALILDATGNLYGTTYFGGVSKAGVVYKLDSTGKETVLHSFHGKPDGSHPFAGVIQDAAGNLYGTTQSGGASRKGVVYMLNKAGKKTILYSFTGGADGAIPNGGLLRDTAGNLYGTTANGGTLSCEHGKGCGTVFKLDTTGKETVLHSFAGSDGANPNAGVVQDAAGNFYGTTFRGGASAHGTVFELDPTGKETLLHSFAGKDGALPFAGLLFDGNASFYGTTTSGGVSGNGVVFVLNGGKVTVLYKFKGGTDGAHLWGGLVRDAAGNLYGTTTGGGVSGCSGYGCGTVFKLDSTNKKSELYAFTGGTDGANPYAGVVRDTAGNLFGTASLGGSGNGLVYEVKP